MNAWTPDASCVEDANAIPELSCLPLTELTLDQCVLLIFHAMDAARGPQFGGRLGAANLVSLTRVISTSWDSPFSAYRECP